MEETDDCEANDGGTNSPWSKPRGAAPGCVGGVRFPDTRFCLMYLGEQMAAILHWTQAEVWVREAAVDDEGRKWGGAGSPTARSPLGEDLPLE